MAAEKSAGILALLGKPSGESGGAGESEDPAQQAAEDAFAEMWSAGEAGDWAGAVSAYKDLKKACEALTSSSETEETETEEAY